MQMRRQESTREFNLKSEALMKHGQLWQEAKVTGPRMSYWDDQYKLTLEGTLQLMQSLIRINEA